MNSLLGFHQQFSISKDSSNKVLLLDSSTGKFWSLSKQKFVLLESRMSSGMGSIVNYQDLQQPMIMSGKKTPESMELNSNWGSSPLSEIPPTTGNLYGLAPLKVDLGIYPLTFGNLYILIHLSLDCSTIAQSSRLKKIIYDQSPLKEKSTSFGVLQELASPDEHGKKLVFPPIRKILAPSFGMDISNMRMSSSMNSVEKSTSRISCVGSTDTRSSLNASLEQLPSLLKGFGSLPTWTRENGIQP